MIFLSSSTTTTFGVLALGNWKRCGTANGLLPLTIPSNGKSYRFPSVLRSSGHSSSSSSSAFGTTSTPDGVESNYNINNDKEKEKNTKNGGWRRMDWNSFDISNTMNYATGPHISTAPLMPVHYPHPSPIQLLQVRNRPIYIKRDDLLRLSHSNNISGNKARKLLSLSLLPPSEFPSVIVSYGGPQSNAMVALAAMVHQKDREAASCTNCTSTSSSTDRHKRFLYYTKKLPRYLRDQPCGNLVRATTLGMELHQVSAEEYKQLFGTEVDGKLVQYPPQGLHLPSSIHYNNNDANYNNDILWIPQGAACGVAYQGVYQLAKEISYFWMQEQKRMKRHLPLTVIIPSGTGTVALFLHQALKQQQQQEVELEKISSVVPFGLDIQVCAIPCVGDTSYLIRQMIGLDIATGGLGLEQNLPHVWEVDSSQRFGEPTQEILQTFQEMKQYGLFLDLLYGAPTWNLMLRQGQFQHLFPKRQIMYVHCGGLEGISTQLTRYKHKGLIDARDIQV